MLMISVLMLFQLQMVVCCHLTNLVLVLKLMKKNLKVTELNKNFSSFAHQLKYDFFPRERDVRQQK